MKNKLVLNSAEDAEIISVRLDPERFPIAYANKVECLMLSGLSEEEGDDAIIGRIGGVFYDFLAKRNERREAFGGRKFDIVLNNGEIEKCEGQWWDAVTDRAREELEKEGQAFCDMITERIEKYEQREPYNP